MEHSDGSMNMERAAHWAGRHSCQELATSCYASDLLAHSADRCWELFGCPIDDVALDWVFGLKFRVGKTLNCNV